jgi:carbamoyltransferase
MRLLSLYFGHDSAICLLEDGRAVAVVEKERRSRVRHDQGWMEIQPVLEHYGWSTDSIDYVVINPDIWETFDGLLGKFSLTGRLYTEREDYRQPGLRCAAEARYSHHDIELFSRTLPCVAVDHHLGHISAGFYTSPFETAAVLSADGGGDLRTRAGARGEGSRIVEIEYGWGGLGGAEVNIGSSWGSVGQHYLGYSRRDAAGKLMGLAPYGQARPDLVEAISTLAQTDPFGFLPEELVPRDGFLDSRNQLIQDLAASLQEYTTRLYLDGAARLAQLFGDDNLVLSGGCSMNCVANTAVHVSGLFGDTFVPAQPSDCGLALGQALFAWHHVLGNPRETKAWSPYLGNDVGAATPAMVASAVEHLLAGRTVGFCAGAAENGPRALGHRSILADPRQKDIRDRINDTIKFREWYRPFAPMVLEEEFGEHFEPFVPSLYMSYVTNVIGTELPGVTHVDGTTRPQVVRANDGVARALLEEWKRRSGIGVLLNTSFNAKEPMVDSVADAMNTWSKSALDVVITPEGECTK